MQYRKQREKTAEEQVLELIKRERAKLPKLGGKKLYRKIKKDLEKNQIKLGRDKMYEVLRSNDLLIKRKGYKKPKTDSNHPFRKYKNLLKEQEIKRKNQVWVSDITYIKVGERWNYLTLVMDLYSRKIMGWSFSKGMSVKQTTQRAIAMAVKTRKKKKYPTILHSDRGFQYCNPKFVERNKKYDIHPSMTNNGDPYENAAAERLNGILKYEFYLTDTFTSYQIAREAIGQAIELYNTERPHLSLGYKTPNEIYNAA